MVAARAELGVAERDRAGVVARHQARDRAEHPGHGEPAADRRPHHSRIRQLRHPPHREGIDITG